MRNFRTFVTLFAFAMLAAASLGTALAQQQYGFAVKRPIMGGACPDCVWGPFAEVVKKIMAKRGWDVQVCYNCNVRESPLFVAGKWIPHDLRPGEWAIGDPPPPKGPVDFGVTNERALYWAYHGTHDYVKEGPQRNLRMLAAFEDPAYLIVAVRKGSGITDLAQIREKKMPVRIHSGNAGNALLAPIFEYYGITPKELESWGGKFVGGNEAKKGVDVLLNRSGSNANNLESQIWNWASNTMELDFLTLPQDLRDKLVKEQGYRPVTLARGYLPGIKDPIPTLEYSGQVLYGRDDMPEQVAYELTKAVDEDRLEFLWSIRMFVADPRTMWKSADVPLHPGAERYYREVGYMK